MHFKQMEKSVRSFSRLPIPLLLLFLELVALAVVPAHLPVDLVEEVDHVVLLAGQDGGGAVELVCHHAQISRQFFAVIAAKKARVSHKENCDVTRRYLYLTFLTYPWSANDICHAFSLKYSYSASLCTASTLIIVCRMVLGGWYALAGANPMTMDNLGVRHLSFEGKSFALGHRFLHLLV